MVNPDIVRALEYAWDAGSEEVILPPLASFAAVSESQAETVQLPWSGTGEPTMSTLMALPFMVTFSGLSRLVTAIETEYTKSCVYILVEHIHFKNGLCQITANIRAFAV